MLYHSDPPFLEFEPVPNSELGTSVDEVIIFEQGALIGGASGIIKQVIPGFASCDTQQLATSDAELLVPLSNNMVAVSGGNPSPPFPNSITFLEPLD